MKPHWQPSSQVAFIIGSLLVCISTQACHGSDETINDLLGKLTNQDKEVRARAAAMLGEKGKESKPAVPGLIKLLKDDEDTVRVNAVEALGRIGPASKDAVPLLIQVYCAPKTGPPKGVS
jgi:HEAT repeat protein